MKWFICFLFLITSNVYNSDYLETEEGRATAQWLAVQRGDTSLLEAREDPFDDVIAYAKWFNKLKPMTIFTTNEYLKEMMIFSSVGFEYK